MNQAAAAVDAAERRLRPAPGPYCPFDAGSGDRFARAGGLTTAGAAGHPGALEHARARAAGRGCRQRLTIKRGGVGAGRWVVQDVR